MYVSRDSNGTLLYEYIEPAVPTFEFDADHPESLQCLELWLKLMSRKLGELNPLVLHARAMLGQFQDHQSKKFAELLEKQKNDYSARSH